ncbi:hypothetical protein B12599_00720 [Campylobacter jejuni]|nr:hypothetical protein B10666_04790 [Campylobacter jejuni]GML22511.1 hypothetical protein B10776_00720 [Campylobacter jejuni]GML90542.1 hypothetical protein B12599_00720 [Campylobacter jejuni]GML94436.1 hypothetical protein I11849_04240 [Campylobacter jejuni]
MCIRKQKSYDKRTQNINKKSSKADRIRKNLFTKFIESILKIAPINPPKPTTKRVFSKA